MICASLYKGSPVERKRKGRDSGRRGRHGFEKSGDEQAEEELEDLSETRLLVASPPLGQKRLGARPFVGRPPPSGCVEREGLQEQDLKDFGSIFLSQARSCGGKGTRGEQDGDNSGQTVRSAAAEGKNEQIDMYTERDVTYGATGGNDRAALGFSEESVRAVAEGFVGNVLDDMSWTASLSRNVSPPPPPSPTVNRPETS